MHNDSGEYDETINNRNISNDNEIFQIIHLPWMSGLFGRSHDISLLHHSTIVNSSIIINIIIDGNHRSNEIYSLTQTPKWNDELMTPTTDESPVETLSEID